MKSAKEAMEILAAYDLTKSYRAAAALAGCSHHTVARLVAERDTADVPTPPREKRSMLIDEYLPKIEEWVEHSRGRVRADVAHDKLLALGFTGTERTTRRAVARVKRAYRLGHTRVHRPWITEPGLWLQYDFGDGPVVDGTKTVLLCAWLAWCRHRVVIPLRDRTAPSVYAGLDRIFRRIGGVPTYLLTDNEKMVTTEHIASVAVRNPGVVSFARYYGLVVKTCLPADPATKGGVENTVKLAKADLVPTDHNLAAQYDTFDDLEAACAAILRAGQHPHPPHHPPHPGGDARRRTASPAPGSRRRTHRDLGCDPHRSRTTHRWSRSRTASTRCRTPCSGRRCSSARTAPVPPSGSSSSTTATPGRSRSRGTGGPAPAPRRSATSTSRRPRPGSSTVSRSREPTPNAPSATSVPVPGCGCVRPPRPAPGRSA